MDPMDIIRTAQERRAARCLVSQSGIPCPTEAWRDYYLEMSRARGPRAGKIAMAKLAIKYGNITDEGKDIYREYLADRG